MHDFFSGLIVKISNKILVNRASQPDDDNKVQYIYYYFSSRPTLTFEKKRREKKSPLLLWSIALFLCLVCYSLSLHLSF